MSLKISNDTIGNRIHDFPACSVVPQQTASPRFPNINYNIVNERTNKQTGGHVEIS